MSEASPRPRIPTLDFVLVIPGEQSQRFQAQAGAIAADLRLTHPGISAAHSSAEPSARAFAALLAETLQLAPPAVEAGLAADGGDGAQAASLEHSWEALEALRERYGPEGAVLLVCGEPTVRALICQALSMPPEARDRLRLEPASVSIVEFRGQRTILAALNDSCHQQ